MPLLEVTPTTPNLDGYFYVPTAGRIHLSPEPFGRTIPGSARRRVLCGQGVDMAQPRVGWLCQKCAHIADVDKLPAPAPLPLLQVLVDNVTGPAWIDEPSGPTGEWLGPSPAPAPFTDALPQLPVQEFVSFPAHPADASDVLAALGTAVEMAEVWLADGADGTLEDKLRLHALLSTLNWANGRLTAVATAVENDLTGSLAEPTEVDGTTWTVHRKWKRSGFKKDELRSAINRWASRDRDDVDEETGELSTRPASVREVVADVWVLAEPATGRTAKFRERGIRLDDYADGREELRIVEFDPLTVPPEE